LPSSETNQNDTSNNAQKFQWKNGVKTAVSLTYDDGLDCHLDIVRPALDQYGFKASFYCTGSSPSLANRMGEWSALVKAGHELGNHSLFHPCQRIREGREEFHWVKEEYDLANYNMQQLVAELALANTLLNAVDGNSKRTYAYTCSDYWVGKDTDYVALIKPLFTAARCRGEIPINMKQVNLYLMPSWQVKDITGKELIAYVEKAAEQGTVATIMFHSVGGGYINISKEAHNELLKYLHANQDKFWVDTFQNITQHIKSERKRLGWE